MLLMSVGQTICTGKPTYSALGYVANSLYYLTKLHHVGENEVHFSE